MGASPKTILLLAFLCLAVPAMSAEPQSLDRFVRSFDYAVRKDMKCSGRDLLALLAKDEAVLVDIRFHEEKQVWDMNFGLHIPLNELPDRLKELPKDKIIVTACPHMDRSNIAMVYLRTQGYNSRYLVDGLVGLTELLRGDAARSFWDALNRKK